MNFTPYNETKYWIDYQFKNYKFLRPKKFNSIVVNTWPILWLFKEQIIELKQISENNSLFFIIFQPLV